MSKFHNKLEEEFTSHLDFQGVYFVTTVTED